MNIEANRSSDGSISETNRSSDGSMNSFPNGRAALYKCTSEGNTPSHI